MADRKTTSAARGGLRPPSPSSQSSEKDRASRQRRGGPLLFVRVRKTLLFALLLSPLADCAPDRSFHLMEASIADIHQAMVAGTLTCQDLVQQYLDRIRAYDQQGPAINSMLYINPASLEQADAFDQDFQRTHKLKPLGCIPI